MTTPDVPVHLTPQAVARPRSIARTAAVQALYQMDMAGTDLNQVIEEFEHLRFAAAAVTGGGSDARNEIDHDEKTEGADAQ